MPEFEFAPPVGCKFPGLLAEIQLLFSAAMNHRQLIAIGTGTALLVSSWFWAPTIWATPPETTENGGIYQVFHDAPFPGAFKVNAVYVFVPIDLAIIAITIAAVYVLRARHARVKYSN